MAKPYQQSGAYIPRKDAAFRDWAENFSRLISEDPSRFALTKSDADVIANLTERYVKAYVAVQSAETRTPALIQHKDASRASAEASFRVYAGFIRANQGVPNDDRQALGLHIADTTRTPIGRPQSCPLLHVVAAFSGSHILRYADENSPNSRRKPHGALAVQIFVAVGDSITNDPKQARYVGQYSRQPIQVEHEAEDGGKTATFFGRWITKRGLTGPWSLPAWMQIAFGGGVHQNAMADGGSSSRGGEVIKMAA